jgi:hypothetical protein
MSCAAETGASASETRSAAKSHSLAAALAALRSLHDGDRGVAEVAAHGADAIPALRALLFERESSGLFETRVRAVEALALIGAHDVLIEFLESPYEAADPVERLGDDAIVNAAGRAVGIVGGPRVFYLLLSLAREEDPARGDRSARRLSPRRGDPPSCRRPGGGREPAGGGGRFARPRRGGVRGPSGCGAPATIRRGRRVSAAPAPQRSRPSPSDRRQAAPMGATARNHAGSRSQSPAAGVPDLFDLRSRTRALGSDHTPEAVDVDRLPA